MNSSTFFYFFFIICGYLFVWIPTENNLRELILLFHHVGLSDQTLSSGLVTTAFIQSAMSFIWQLNF